MNKKFDDALKKLERLMLNYKNFKCDNAIEGKRFYSNFEQKAYPEVYKRICKKYEVKITETALDLVMTAHSWSDLVDIISAMQARAETSNKS